MELIRENPTARSGGGGARIGSLGGGRSEDTTTGARNKARLRVRLGDAVLTVTGRAAQTLALLVERGARGFTSGEASPLGWARRTSEYVRQLRKLGFEIVTTWERAGDARIGRYTLASVVEILPEGGGQ